MSQYSDPRNLPDDPTNVEVPAPEDQPGYAPPDPRVGEKPNTVPPGKVEVPAPEDQPGYAPPDPNVVPAPEDGPAADDKSTKADSDHRSKAAHPAGGDKQEKK